MWKSLSTAAMLFLAPMCEAQRVPATPVATPLFNANLTFAAPLPIGVTPFGNSAVRPINGGTFTGARLNGKVSFGVAETLLGKGALYADALYVLTTDDGVNIKVTERAKIPHVELLFEAPTGKYNWLNNVTAWATGSETSAQVTLYVWTIAPGRTSY